MTTLCPVSRRTLLLGTGTVAALTLAACGADSGSDASGAGGAGGDEEIIIGSTNEPTGLQRNVGGSSGISETMSRNVYEGLTAIDDSGEVVDLLAESVEVSEDGLTHTFTLRAGVKFHDGSPLTAQDAAWSIAETISEESLSARASDLRVISDIEATDDQTLVLTLDHRSASLRFFLASVTIVRDGDTENTSENGTGPYRMQEWVQGDHLTLVRNDDYWGEPALNPGVTFRFFADETAMNNALRTGELDLVIQQESPDQLGQFEDDPTYTITEGNSIRKWVWTFNNQVEPFTDVRVRQGLYKAINRDAILTAVWGDRGEIIGSMPPVPEPWYDESFAQIHAYDPDAATALLEEAGATDLSFALTYVAGSTEELVVQQIVSDLSAVGVTVELDAIDDSTWYERVYSEKNYETTLMHHNNPRDVLWYANPDFYWQYDSSEVQELAVAAEEAEDEDAQADLIHELSGVLAEEAPSAWLFMAPQIRIAREGVTGFSPDKNAEPFYVASIVRESA